MKNILYAAFLFLLFSRATAQSPNWLWAKQLYGTSLDEYGWSVAVDPHNGDVYTTSYFFGTVDFDPGPGVFNLTSAGGSDIFISKLDSAGNFIWAKQIGGIWNDEGHKVAIDPTNSAHIYLTGIFDNIVDFDPGAGVFNLGSAGQGDIFIARYDSAGHFVWAKSMGEPNIDFGRSLVVDPSGNGSVYTTGTFNGTVDFDPGPGIFNLTSAGGFDLFLSKLDSSGNFLWAGRWGTFSDDVMLFAAINPSSSNEVYLTGWYEGMVDFDPGAGTYNMTASGQHDIFICKLDSTGHFQWSKSIGGSGEERSNAIAIVPSGNAAIYLCGTYDATADFDPGPGTYNLTPPGSFFSKLDSAGNFIWAKSVIGGVQVNSMVTDTLENIYSAGTFGGTVDFDPGPGMFSLPGGLLDIFVLKMDSAGNFLWAKATGSNCWMECKAIDINTNGQAYITGEFALDPVTFGSTTLNSSGSLDIYIAKLDGIPVPSATMDLEPDAMFRLMPNPASEQMTIYDARNSIDKIEICNALGKIVFEKHTSSHSGRQTFNIADFKPGIYLITVTDGAGNRATKKLVKM